MGSHKCSSDFYLEMKMKMISFALLVAFAASRFFPEEGIVPEMDFPDTTVTPIADTKTAEKNDIPLAYEDAVTEKSKRLSTEFSELLTGGKRCRKNGKRGYCGCYSCCGCPGMNKCGKCGRYDCQPVYCKKKNNKKEKEEKAQKRENKARRKKEKDRKEKDKKTKERDS